MSRKLFNRTNPEKYALDEADLDCLQDDDAEFMSDRGAAVVMGASRTSHLILIHHHFIPDIRAGVGLAGQY